MLVPQLGTSSAYLCTQKEITKASLTNRKIKLKIKGIMKNTEFNLETLGTLISSDSFQALLELTSDLGLEVTGEQK